MVGGKVGGWGGVILGEGCAKEGSKGIWRWQGGWIDGFVEIFVPVGSIGRAMDKVVM